MSNKIPSYRHHKPSGLAVVTAGGKDHYLGKYGSTESREAYGRLIARYASGSPVETAKTSTGGLTVCEIVLAFLRHGDQHYRKAGKLTDEVACIKSAVRPLVELYGDTDASDFGPLALKAVRQKMVDGGWTRGYVNKSCGRIRRVFRFAVSNELCEPSVLQRLEAVDPLLEGRTDAHDNPARHVVPQSAIDAVRDETNERTRDLIDLALATGARPGELCMLTGAMLNRSGDIWTAVLDKHKMAHRGKRRVLAFGAKSQLILRKYLKADPSVLLFTITRGTFSNNIKAACDRLEIPRFTGHWLRHNAASEVRRTDGLDGAQIVMGHSKADTTEIYAHLDDERLIGIARKRG